MSHIPGDFSLRQGVNLLQSLALDDEREVAIPTDPVEFCKTVLRFNPTEYQEKFLRDKSQFIALRWSRQSGKSFIVSARLMWEAVVNNGTHIAIVAPSYRQSRLVLRKITDFLIRVPKQLIS